LAASTAGKFLPVYREIRSIPHLMPVHGEK